MNLVPKLSMAFLAGMSLILAVNGYRRVRREVALFESDRIRDDVQIGKTLAAAVTSVGRVDGQARALALVRDADAQEGRVRVRWVWLDEGESPPLPVPRDRVAAIPAGGSLSLVGSEAREERRFTFVPVAVDARRGALELSEPLEAERAYIHRTILDTIATELTLIGVCAAMAMILGAWIVGRPMAALVEKARRVGNGDFSGPLQLKQTDEIARLATEMNAMCDRLVAANERAANEMKARVEMLEQLRHADRLMTVGKLASGIAHELGTPLNVIEARAAMIGNGETNQEESVSYARVIVRATERMTRIIRQLLAFARPREVQKSRCDVAVVAQRTVELLQPLAEKRNVTLRVEGLAPAHAQADAGQIEQAITNLVMNAIQAMDRGGSVELTVDRTRAKPPADHGGPEADYLRIRVRDEGSGISAEHLPRVFEPFFTTKDVGEGTGLGLAVTYGIVREHGGWVAVASELGHGTQFSIHLPEREP
ncbi:MAG: ATP-binding protein [Polyangiaceae bacterium]|jgi:two-component system, NtrC family, sensor kinase